MAPQRKNRRRRLRWMFAAVGGAAVIIAAAFVYRGFRGVTRQYLSDGEQEVWRSEREVAVRRVVWLTPANLGAPFNTAGEEYDPFLTADGWTLYFTVGRAGQNADLFLAERVRGAWQRPRALAELNTPFDEIGPQVSADGLALYFASNRPGGAGGYDLWVSRRESAAGDAVRWGKPAPVPGVNSRDDEYDPCLAPDGRTLFFASNRASRPPEQAPATAPWIGTVRAERPERTFDIWMSVAGEDTPWRTPVPLAVVNTPFDEGQPLVAADGDTLYFASNRPGGLGGYDLWRTRRLQGVWLAPANLGPQVNTAHNELDPALSEEGMTLLFSSDRPGGLGAYDLYLARSRELYTIERVSKWDASTLLATLRQPLAVLLLSLVVTTLALILTLRHWDRVDLLYRCLLVSLVLHGLLLLWFGGATVSARLREHLARAEPTFRIENIVIRRPADNAAKTQQPLWDRLAELTADRRTDIDLSRQALRPGLVAPQTVQVPRDEAVIEVTHADPAKTRVEEAPPAAAAKTVRVEDLVLMEMPTPRPELPEPKRAALPDQPRLEREPAAEAEARRLALAPAARAAPPPAPSSTEPRELLETAAPKPALEAAPPVLPLPPPLAAVPPESTPDPQVAARQAAEMAQRKLQPSAAQPARDAPKRGESDQPAFAFVAQVVANRPTISDTTPTRAIPSETQLALGPTVPLVAPSPASTPERWGAKPEVIPLLPVSRSPEAAKAVTVAAPRPILEAPALSAQRAEAGRAVAGPNAADRPPVDLARPVAPAGPAPTPIRAEPTVMFAPDAAGRRAIEAAAELRAARLNRDPALPRLAPAAGQTAVERRFWRAELKAELLYEMRSPERRRLTAFEAGASPKSEEAVELALKWLAANQNADGWWPCPPSTKADGSALTGLALLAFLGAGYTHREGPYAEVVGRCINWYLRNAKPDGDLRVGGRMYGQGMSTIALCEASSLTKDPRLLPIAQNAVGFIVRARTERLGGWRYQPIYPTNDTSVLGWQVMALKSGELAGIDVPAAVYDGARKWLAHVATGPQKGLFGYDAPGATPAMTAEGMYCQQLMGQDRDHPAMREGADYLMQNLPAWTAQKRDLYYWYYGTLALYHMRDPYWSKWNAALRDLLVSHQVKSGPEAGSWDPDGDKWGKRGGRVYATAFAALCLEVYYRYLPLYREAGEGPAEPTAKLDRP